MGVPVVRHPEGTIRLGMYTQYTLIYHDALDMPTPECEQQWREFEKRFYENTCKDGNAARPEDKVFVERATLELIPDTDRLSWAIGSRYTVVQITEEELQWLQVNGICQVSELVPNVPRSSADLYSCMRSKKIVSSRTLCMTTTKASGNFGASRTSRGYLSRLPKQPNTFRTTMQAMVLQSLL
jgi:hypothetical protein